jgi:hypothetical protein
MSQLYPWSRTRPHCWVCSLTEICTHQLVGRSLATTSELARTRHESWHHHRGFINVINASSSRAYTAARRHSRPNFVHAWGYSTKRATGMRPTHRTTKQNEQSINQSNVSREVEAGLLPYQPEFVVCGRYRDGVDPPLPPAPQPCSRSPSHPQ